MKSVLCLLAFAMAFSQVLGFEVDNSAEEEARFLYNNNNGMFVSLNSTYFVLALGLLAAVAFGALILANQSGQSPFKANYNRYGYEAPEYDQHYYEHQQSRQKRGVAYGRLFF